MSMPNLSLLPVSAEAAVRRVRAAEDDWNTCSPNQVALGYGLDTAWRVRTDVLRGRATIIRFLIRKWNRELEYRVLAEPWTFNADRIAVRYACEWRDDSGNWFRTFGNAIWKLDTAGLITHRYAYANDLPIAEADRRLHWERGRSRPANHPGLSDLGL
jgi:nuclear transport factor 2 (NTF2) superfamily protein